MKLKRVIILVTSVVLCLGLVSCSKNSSTEQQDPQNNMVTCYKYDTMNEKFTDEKLISINIPDGFTATKQEQLMHQNPIYYIGEYKNNQNTISVFEYTDPNFNIDIYQKLNDNWVLGINDDENDNYSHTSYTIKDKNIIGITIVNLDKSELTVENFVSKLSYLVGEELQVPKVEEEKSITVEGTVDNPAKLGEYVSTRIYNKLSGKYEAVLISIKNVYEDRDNAEVQRYNNIGLANTKSFSAYNYPDSSSNIKCMIYEYSIFYPSTFTSNNGVVENTQIPITLVSMNGTDTTINGILNVYETIRDFYDVYKPTAKTGEDFTSGMGVFQMSSGFKNYLIKIDAGDGIPKYFTVK